MDKLNEIDYATYQYSPALRNAAGDCADFVDNGEPSYTKEISKVDLVEVNEVSTLDSTVKETSKFDDATSFNLNFTETDMIQDGKGGVSLSGEGQLVTSLEQDHLVCGKTSLNINLCKNGVPLKLPFAALNFKLPRNSSFSLSGKELSGIALGVWSSCLLLESTRKRE